MTKLYTFYMSLYGAHTKHMFKMASLAVTCIDAVFKRVAYEESEIWTSLRTTQLYQGRLTAAPRLVEFVSVSRGIRALITDITI